MDSEVTAALILGASAVAAAAISRPPRPRKKADTSEPARVAAPAEVIGDPNGVRVAVSLAPLALVLTVAGFLLALGFGVYADMGFPLTISGALLLAWVGNSMGANPIQTTFWLGVIFALWLVYQGAVLLWSWLGPA